MADIIFKVKPEAEELMYALGTAHLDNVCPHPIESSELLKWTSFDELGRDFASFCNETDGLKEEALKLAFTEIFVIPTEAGKTAKDIIDIRLCAYIKALEFILREVRDKKIKDWLLSLLYKSPNIIESFKHAEDTPDVHWFFKNRVMAFLLRKSLICDWDHDEYLKSNQCNQDDPRNIFLDSRSFHIDEEDCFVIIKDIIFPQLEEDFIENILSNTVCADCRDLKTNFIRYCHSETSCPYFALVQSLVDRHDSLLGMLFQFSMEQLLKVDQRYQSRRLLCILFRVAHDRKEWKLINATLAPLLSSNTTGTVTFAIRLFARLIRWNKSRDGTSSEMISEHYDVMMKLLESPLDEIQNANHHFWRCFGGLVRLNPSEYQLRPVAMKSYLRRILRMIAQRRLPDREPKGIWEYYRTFCWLIMPRLDDSDGKFNLPLASHLLSAGLKLISVRGVIPQSFYGNFKSVCKKFRCSLVSDESQDQFDLICDKASWLFVKRLGTNRKRSIQDWVRSVSYMTSQISSCRKEPRAECLSLANYSNYCDILLEIHQCFHNPMNILGPLRCLWFLRVLGELGPWQHDEEKSRAIESCLLRAIEICPRQRSRYYDEAFEIRRIQSALDHLFLPTHEPAYHEDLPERIMSLLSKLSSSTNKIRDIQPRRMLLVSLCKYLIAGSNYTALPEIIDLLGGLELAYKLRAEQENSELASSLPSCVELAFLQPFDDPNNPLYICEFAYFRDTMDYLRRNKPEQFDRMSSQLSADKNERLEYYQNDYDNFNVCCSTRSLDKERDGFRCIEHKISDQAEPQICPLLKRSQCSDHIK